MSIRSRLLGAAIDPTGTESSAAAGVLSSSWLVRGYLLLLGLLLIGYMFMGRGFAHIGVGPIFVGDAVMVAGVVVATIAMVRWGVRPQLSWTLGLLLAFVLLGAVRTVPFISTYGMDALRDGVLWGYAAFALIVYILVDRWSLLTSFRAYGWVVPVFALWLPICWNLFRISSLEIDPNRPGAVIPLVFFKAGDMAVHIVGAVAFLVIGAVAVSSARTFAWRVVIFLPMLWGAFVSATSNRGALVTVVLGIAAAVAIAPRSRNWLPFLAALVLFVAALTAQSILPPLALSSPPSSESGQPASSDNRSPEESARVTPSPREARASPATTHGSGSSSEEPAEHEGKSSEEPSTGPGHTAELANGGFEDDNAAPTGWTAFGGAQVTLAASGAYRGDHYAELENTLGPYEATLTSERFDLAGPDLRVSTRVKAVRGGPLIELYINWYDARGKLLSSDFVNSIRPSRTWQECAGVIGGPPDAASAEVRFYEATGHATAGIDAVAVRTGDFTPDPPPPASGDGRPATVGQMIENLFSIFGGTSDGGLEGTRQFRLAWWGTIIDYTVFGDHFWTGKGFGINLADDDGFQSTSDGSLRAPHNSHLTVLARMGVPGFLLWIGLQSAFGIGLVRAMLARRRAGDHTVAAIGAWILVYWFAMMIDTSFDPYLEGPQGGIWFWTLIGLGLAFMRLDRRSVAT